MVSAGFVSTPFSNYCDNTRRFNMSYDQPATMHPKKKGRVAWSIDRVEKIIGSAESNRVGRGTGTTGIFLGPWSFGLSGCICIYLTVEYHHIFHGRIEHWWLLY